MSSSSSSPSPSPSPSKYYCSQHFLSKHHNTNPGLLIWDPIRSNVPCDSGDKMMTVKQFHYKCKKHDYDTVHANVGLNQGCVSTKGDKNAMMCTQSKSEFPWCTQ